MSAAAMPCKSANKTIPYALMRFEGLQECICICASALRPIVVSGAAIQGDSLYSLQERERNHTRPSYAFPGLPKYICACRVDFRILLDTSSGIVVLVILSKALQKPWCAEGRTEGNNFVGNLATVILAVIW